MMGSLKTAAASRCARGAPIDQSVNGQQDYTQMGKTYAALERSSTWLHMATNKSKNSWVPPFNISSCIVPLFLKVLRQRMMRAR